MTPHVATPARGEYTCAAEKGEAAAREAALDSQWDEDEEWGDDDGTWGWASPEPEAAPASPSHSPQPSPGPEDAPTSPSYSPQPSLEPECEASR